MKSHKLWVCVNKIQSKREREEKVKAIIHCLLLQPMEDSNPITTFFSLEEEETVECLPQPMTKMNHKEWS
jgi:hypothetical protein